ncbi:MAG: SGNH/GDSL hydrolase family protein [Anaerolineae bacterium]|jgi:hypothetical protein|nr:SGNH/GDSL hydrolase family protein [Anaerolineae bacterium]
MKKLAAVVVMLFLGMILIACAQDGRIETPVVLPTILPTSTATTPPTATDLPEDTPTPQPVAEKTQAAVDTPTPLPPTATPFDPANWRELPVVPSEVSDRVKEIYQQGQALGRSDAAFMKVGDCGSATDWYLMDFDRGSSFYDLGAYQDLQTTIDQFAGSFERRSVAAVDGFRASSILSEFWADPEECAAGETPLSCEIRIMNPSIALITMGTNDVTKIEAFEPGLRRILDALIEAGIVPVLATKADNLEGDHSVNEIIVSVAVEYQIPVWNYWAALQDLPDGGLQEDGAHLTWGPNFFNDPRVMEKGWPVRNLTALQVLDAVWRELVDN